MKIPIRSIPVRWLAGAAVLISCQVSGYTQTAPANVAVPPAKSPASKDVVTLDALQVTGTALRSQEAVNDRRASLTVADTLTQDDLGTLADETLADAMIRIPGVSTMQTLYGEQEASYVSTRGISPDLSFVSFDGISMFSTANDGDGLRRVDLNLIPTQISRRTSVFKSFTADMDAGAIGSVVNIEPYSALNGRETGHITGQLITQTGTGKYVPGDNSLGNYRDQPLGGGAKGLWVKRLGADGRFGVVLSGMYQQRNYDYTKRNPNGRVFYTTAGATAAANLSNWDGLHPFPTLIRPMDYTHYTQTHGGSAQLEYRLSDTWQVSLLGFGYKQVEDQNLNMFYVETFTGLTRPSPEEGRFRIGRTRPSFSYDRFQQETRGLIFKAVGKFRADSSLEFRASRFANEFYDLDLTTIYAYSPPASFITFDMTNLVDKFSIENYGPLAVVSNYQMSSAEDNTVKARVDSTEARLDYKKNYGSQSTGFGFMTGVDLRETKDKRDATNVTFVANTANRLTDLGFVPNFSSENYGYPVVWIDYEKYAQNAKPGLAINPATSNNGSWSRDYFYKERILAGYFSAKYGTERTHTIAGLRYDHVDFNALSPQNVGGTFNGNFSRYTGGYDHLLPSLNLSHFLTQGVRLKAGVSQSLGRPQFGDIAQAETRNNTNLTIARGNANLQPRQANNYDLTLEYFFAGSGLMSVGTFYKDIKDDIYTSSAEETIDGVIWTVTTPRNASASKMKGVEGQIIHDAIPGLPGFLEKRLGVSLNYTKLWGEMDYLSGSTWVHLKALQYQPDWIANATVFYSLPAKGEIRVSWHWKGHSPISLGATPWTTYWLRAQKRVDVGVRYSLTKRLVVKLQANNLTSEPVEQGYHDPYAMNRYEMGRDRTFSLDFTLKL